MLISCTLPQRYGRTASARQPLSARRTALVIYSRRLYPFDRRRERVKTRVAVACFLLANIFLGIIGTFWFRTEYRKGEMGLRMALGSTRRQLNSIMVGEGVLLLVLAFIPSLVISFNIAHMDLIDTYQLPFTWLRLAICGGITFVLIVLMIICGVWYPARSTARLEPAEALHYE